MRTSEFPTYPSDFTGWVICTVEVSPGVFAIRRVDRSIFQVGPAGPPGPAGTGAQGPQGIPGPAGEDGQIGSVWYVDAGAPLVGLGVNGDLYLNATNGDVYQKAAGVWGVVNNLTGPAGAAGVAGADGSVWHVGAGVPAGGLGVDDDFYLNSSNGDVYLKAAGVWGVVDNITGPAGADFVASYNTLNYAGTVDISFTNVNTYLQITLAGDLILTTSNRAAARNKVIFLVGDGSVRGLTFPAGWTFVNASGMPATLAANKTAVLSIVCRNGNDSGVLAAYTEQP